MNHSESGYEMESPADLREQERFWGIFGLMRTVVQIRFETEEIAGGAV